MKILYTRIVEIKTNYMIGRINMFTLVPFMIEKIGIILIVALLLSQLRSFRKIIQNEQSQKDKVLLLFLFVKNFSIYNFCY